MSQSVTHLAAHLRGAAEAVGAAAVRLAGHDPGGAAFGAGQAGALGELGQGLYEQWRSALRARAGEAADHAVRLRAAADDVTRAAGRYAEADQRAAGRPEQRVG
jgi:hypothetical protein